MLQTERELVDAAAARVGEGAAVADIDVVEAAALGARPPRGTQELQLKVAKARDELTHVLGRSPTVEENTESVDASLEDTLSAIQSVQAHRTRSFDEPAGEDSTLAESLGATDPELGRAEIRVLLDEAFDVLSERDREILRLRFEEDLTQTEISRIIGVSQMQVSRLIRQSLARLQMDIDQDGGHQRLERSLRARISAPLEAATGSERAHPTQRWPRSRRPGMADYRARLHFGLT